MDRGCDRQILITGDSGAGKSALIANWLEAHGRRHPEDVLHAHHLGCTNDASAVRPLLARLIENASRLLQEQEVISEPLAIPEDWWELVAAVAQTLEAVGAWAQRSGRRWIWVLDGLDRLDQDDQTTLPWLPTTLPPGVQVVASALACQARDVIREREYTTLTIGPLHEAAQKQLIAQVLGRYTKQLDPALLQRILSHPLAGSPLFLRVLLEELRQCGHYDTLPDQLDFYLSAQTIDDLYERVLERLESDGHGDSVRRVMTALWASRAGLSKAELLTIRQLAPLQWAPIDLALEQAFGRNGNRLVFDHDFLRIAVQDRYLPTEEAQRQAHSELADWYQEHEGWDERVAEEWHWQLKKASRLEELRNLLLKPDLLAKMILYRGTREVINYWLVARGERDSEIDEQIADDLEKEIEKRREDTEDLIWLIDSISDLFDDAGLYREPLLRLRTLSLELEKASACPDEKAIFSSMLWLANAHHNLGDYEAALPLYESCIEGRRRLLGTGHPDTLTTIDSLGRLYRAKGDYEQAEVHYMHALEARERQLGNEHPDTLTTVDNLGTLCKAKGDYKQAESYYMRALDGRERLQGHGHPDTLTTVSNLGNLFRMKGDYEKAETYYIRALEARERLLGPGHPNTLTTVGNLGNLYRAKGDYKRAETFYMRALGGREQLLGPGHPDTLTTVGNLGNLYMAKGDLDQAEACYHRALKAQEQLLGRRHPATLTTVTNLARLYQDKGNYRQANAYYSRALTTQERLLGPEHPTTLATMTNLAGLYQDKGNYVKAEALYMRALDARERLQGSEHPSTIATVVSLGNLYQDMGHYEKAEACYVRALETREWLLGPEHPDTKSMQDCLANLLRETWMTEDRK